MDTSKPKPASTPSNSAPSGARQAAIEVSRAIARMEGWYRPTSVQHVNNNPGNIMDVDFYKATGQFKLRKYPAMVDGWNALRSLVEKSLFGKRLTLLEFIGGKKSVYNGYAPQGHGNNDPANYARLIGQWLSLPVNEPAQPEWADRIVQTDKLPEYGGA